MLRSLRPYFSPASRSLEVGAKEADDAAVWRAETGRVVATVDTMVEGIDFRLDWPGYRFRFLGRRLMAINLSDLAAMGAQPRHALISLCLPGRLRLREVRDLYRGIAERARSAGCTVAGGDLSGIDGPVVLTAALYGTIRPGQRPLRRSGARSGWALAVTGSVGRAAAGIGLLLAGKKPKTTAERRWVRAVYDPQPRVEAAQILQSVGIRVAGDISDGLYREIERIAEPAGLGAVVEADQLPLDADLRRSREHAWSGGLMESEDYELLCAAPRPLLETARRRLRHDLDLELSIIGTLQHGRGIRVRVDGKLGILPGLGAGYQHFR